MGVIVDVITYKYFTLCIIFRIIGTYLWKLQEDMNSVPTYRMAFFTYRLWSVNCDLPEIWTIWACLQVTCKGFILRSKCEQLNFVHWVKVSLAFQKVVPQATRCLQRVKSMNSLGKYILIKTMPFLRSLAFPIFLMTAKILFALIKTIRNAKDPGDEFVSKKFWETVESLFFL